MSLKLKEKVSTKTTTMMTIRKKQWMRNSKKYLLQSVKALVIKIVRVNLTKIIEQNRRLIQKRAVYLNALEEELVLVVVVG